MPHKDIDPKGFHGSVERQQNGLPIATSPKLRLFRFEILKSEIFVVKSIQKY